MKLGFQIKKNVFIIKNSLSWISKSRYYKTVIKQEALNALKPYEYAIEVLLKIWETRRRKFR